MQNNGFVFGDEGEPRKIPQQASNSDIRPFPMVPEVSLVMDKPQQVRRQMGDSLTDKVPESRHFKHDVYHQEGDSYAAWKEKRYPQQTNVTSSPIYQMYTSTRNASGLQDNCGSRQVFKPYNAVEFGHHNSNNHHLDNQSQNRYTNRSEAIDSSNKYPSNYLTNRNDNNHCVNNNHAKRSSNEGNRAHSLDYGWSDEKIPTDRRRWSDEQRSWSDGSKQYKQPQALEAYDLINKLRQQRSSLCSNPNSNIQKSTPVEYDCRLNYGPVQQAHSSQEHCHHQSVCCTMNYPNHNTSTETETVRNLLQVITSQNEQIRNLQKQFDRMIKLHEQSLKNKNQCTCQPSKHSNEILYQNSHLYDQSRNSNLPISHTNLLKENEKCLSDLKLQDDRTKKTILEQKVSIGVMTSFELKVQNNPSMPSDYENKQKGSQEKIKPSIETSNMVKNLVNDTEEMIKKKHNFFTPTPLENISEGSESHMSSLRQSHLCSDSTRQSIEARDSAEPVGTKYLQRNFRNQENVQVNLESNKHQNTHEEIARRKPVSEYAENNEAMFEKNTRGIQRTTPYEYDFEFENVRSTPKVDPPRDDGSDESNTEPLSDITKMKHTKVDNYVDECLSLSESELDVEDPSPPSPEPSIHLDMQEFSSEGGSLPPQQATKVGWTLYNNVLDQVNQILQNSPGHENRDRESPDDYRDNEERNCDNNFIIDTVKAATLEQLTKLGISFSENIDQRKTNGNKKVMFDASYYPKQAPLEAQIATSSSVETNTSMHMKALARKYFNEEPLSEAAVQKTQTGALMQTSSLQNTNMSFATMHYLQRYHLLPGNNSNPAKEMVKDNYKPSPIITEKPAIKTAERREPSPRRHRAHSGTSKVSFPSKILDISTLKQQPKLL
ncbi:myb-like protein P [Copidosoma floridanum]|uniref:myb-like protein P n=1 Tax=Copidosoma floridanum TaxID=29053 RepID=UPI0006C986F0|nr:myb-like protein P [Copidosoma floridanum]